MSEITLSELAQSLNDAANKADLVGAVEVKTTAGRIAETQKATVRVRSGKTRDSITVTDPEGRPLGPASIVAEIGPTHFVGALLERGTVNTPPFPFVATSADEHIDDHQKRVRDAAVRSMGWRT